MELLDDMLAIAWYITNLRYHVCRYLLILVLSQDVLSLFCSFLVLFLCSFREKWSQKSSVGLPYLENTVCKCVSNDCDVFHSVCLLAFSKCMICIPV